MTMNGCNRVAKTHNTHVKIVNEFIEYTKKMAGGRKRNYWWPHVATVTAFENQWFKFIFREYNTEDRKQYAYRGIKKSSQDTQCCIWKSRSDNVPIWRKFLFLNEFHSHNYLKHRRNVSTRYHKETHFEYVYLWRQHLCLIIIISNQESRPSRSRDFFLWNTV